MTPGSGYHDYTCRTYAAAAGTLDIVPASGAGSEQAAATGTRWHCYGVLHDHLIYEVETHSWVAAQKAVSIVCGAGPTHTIAGIRHELGTVAHIAGGVGEMAPD